MSTDLPKRVLESADITAITQLILRERESRDLGRWETMRACFWPDSLVRVSWFRGNGPDFVRGSIDMAKRGLPAKHRLGPILVRLNEDRAVASLTGTIELPVEIGGVQGTLSSHARFLYRVERRKAEWRLFGFDAVYCRDELTAALPGETIAIDPSQAKEFRPSYRMLCYYLKNLGFSIDLGLAGEDRPDLIDRLNQELFGWAGLPLPN